MWIETRQRGSDMTAIDVEWTKRVLAIAEARLGKEHQTITDSSLECDTVKDSLPFKGQSESER